MDYNINWISYEGWEIFVTKELQRNDVTKDTCT